MRQQSESAVTHRNQYKHTRAAFEEECCIYNFSLSPERLKKYNAGLLLRHGKYRETGIYFVWIEGVSKATLWKLTLRLKETDPRATFSPLRKHKAFGHLRFPLFRKFQGDVLLTNIKHKY